MQGRKESNSKFFYDVTIDKLVPKNHIIRKIDKALDLSFLYTETKKYYSHEGKPSIDPVVLFKIYIIGYFFGISSERQLFRDLQVNLAYRWYIGYDLDEEIPDHSIMTKSRYRFSKEVFEKLFKRIIHLCKEAGLISGDYYFIDSSIIRADASRESFRVKLRSDEEFLNELQDDDHEKKQFEGFAFDGIVDPNKMGKRRHRVKKSETYKSKTDEDAEIITRPGKGTIPAYKAHFCVDGKKRVVVAVDGTRASEDDMSKVHDLYTNSLFVTGKKPNMIIADSHYGGIECLKYFQDQNIRTCIPPRYSDTLKGKFINTDFNKSQVDGGLHCPAGQITTRKVKHRFRTQYKFAKHICNSCLLKNRCTDSQNGRIVSFYNGPYFSNAVDLTKSTKGRKLLRERQVIVEGVISEAKNRHHFHRCKYRRLEKFKIQLYLTAMVINIKRLMKQQDKFKENSIISIFPGKLIFSFS